MTRSCLVVLILVLAVISTPVGRVDAQAAGRRAAAGSEYDSTLREALVEFGRGNWVEARALFERAHELNPSARTLRAIGLTAFEEKRYVTAFTTLATALEDQRKPLNEAQRAEATDVMRRADGFIARYALDVSPQEASLRVDAGTAVLLDGKLLLDPGEHELLVSADGFESVQRRIMAQPREDRRLRIALTSNQVAAPTHAPDVQAPAQVVTAAPTRADDGSSWSTQRYVGLSVAAAGVLLLAGSVYFGLHAKAQYDDSGCAKGGCADAAAKRLNDDAITSGRIGTGLFIGGLVAAGTGTFLMLWTSSSDQPTHTSASAHLAPSLSPMQLGLQIGGTF